MTEVEIIQGVIDLLSERERWTKFAVARATPGGQDDRYDFAVHIDPLSKKAESWCLGGAICKVIGSNDWGAIDPRVHRRFNRLAATRAYDYNFVEFNNSPSTTHEDLMMFLKEALYDAQADEAREHILENERAAFYSLTRKDET